MIVRPGSGVLHLIPQPAHAALARRIMDHFDPLAGHDRRDSIVLAIQEHDFGWHEPDAAPLVDRETGQILDFVHVPAGIRQGVWPRAVAHVSHDPWAAALVAHHAVTVYARFRGDPQWDGFFAQIAAARDASLGVVGRTRETLEDDYVFLQLGDVLSLAFCTRATETQIVGGWTARLHGDALVVHPSGFTDDVPFDIDAREIADRPYASEAVLQAAMHEAPMRRLQGVVVGTATAEVR